MAAQIADVFDASLADKVDSCKLLVVGAGRIGCEVLYKLVMPMDKFMDIEIVSRFLSFFAVIF